MLEIQRGSVTEQKAPDFGISSPHRTCEECGCPVRGPQVCSLTCVQSSAGGTRVYRQANPLPREVTQG